MIARLSEAVFPQPGPVLNGIGDTVASPDATHPGDDSTETHISQNYPKPVEILQDLQSELYGQAATSSEQTSLLDVVSVGILSNETAIELLRTSVTTPIRSCTTFLCSRADNISDPSIATANGYHWPRSSSSLAMCLKDLFAIHLF